LLGYTVGRVEGKKGYPAFLAVKKGRSFRERRVECCRRWEKKIVRSMVQKLAELLKGQARGGAKKKGAFNG